jgi:hypothetical protein
MARYSLGTRPHRIACAETGIALFRALSMKHE